MAGNMMAMLMTGKTEICTEYNGKPHGAQAKDCAARVFLNSRRVYRRTDTRGDPCISLL